MTRSYVQVRTWMNVNAACRQSFTLSCVFQVVAHRGFWARRGGVCVWRMCQQPFVSTQSCKTHPHRWNVIFILNIQFSMKSLLNPCFFLLFKSDRSTATSYWCSMFSPNHYFGECLPKQSDNVIFCFVYYRDWNNFSFLWPHFSGCVWRRFCSTGRVCLATGTACLNTSCTASNGGWRASTRWARKLEETISPLV